MKLGTEIGAWGRLGAVGLLMTSMILASCGKSESKRSATHNADPVETVDAIVAGSPVGLSNEQKKTLLLGLMPACERQQEKLDLKAQITSEIRRAGLSPADISINASRTSGGTKDTLEIRIKGEQISVSCSSQATSPLN